MALVCENSFQPGFLTIGEQRVAGAQSASYSVERIPGATAVPAGLLLDALSAQVELDAGQGDDVEGVHDRCGLGQDLGGRGLVAAEPVHRHDLDLIAEGCGLR